MVLQAKRYGFAEPLTINGLQGHNEQKYCLKYIDSYSLLIFPTIVTLLSAAS